MATARASEQHVAASTPTTVSAGAVAWVVGALVFVLLRVGPLWLTSVGGAELEGLSGAWRAHLGEDDGRFLGTLVQGLAALSFELTTSELPIRILVVAATATVPLALWLLRPALGPVGALGTLFLLAFDGPGIALGATASAAAFDIALVAWAAVLVANGGPGGRTWIAGAAGFLAATAGPGPLIVVMAGLFAAAGRGWRPSRVEAAWAAGGVAVAILLASLRFGGGWDGLLVPPFEVVGASATREWSTGAAWELAAIYSIPALAAAGVAAFVVMREARSDESSPLNLAMAVAFLVSAGWLVVSLGDASPLPLVVTTTTGAFVAGPVLARAAAAAWHAEWRTARWILALAVAFTLLATFRVLDWAGDGDVGPAREKGAMAAFLAGMAVCLVAVAYDRRSRASLVAFAGLFAVPLMIATAFGTSLGAQEEPVPSPVVTSQASDLREIAMRISEQTGRPIVVHPDLFEALTWAFRDSGELTISSEPGDAGVFIAPIDGPAPPGLVPVTGDWVIQVGIQPPTDRFLDYVRWLGDRNGLDVVPLRVAVFSGAAE